MDIKEYAAAMDSWRQEFSEKAVEACASSPCILSVRPGEGAPEIVARMAVAAGPGHVAVFVPSSIAEAWHFGLDTAIVKLAAEKSVEVHKRRQDSVAACASAAEDGGASGKYHFHVMPPSQAGCVGDWCAAYGSAPFSLVIADDCQLYANPCSERSRGLKAVSSCGARIAGIAHGASALESVMRAGGMFAGSAVIRPGLPREEAQANV